MLGLDDGDFDDAVAAIFKAGVLLLEGDDEGLAVADPLLAHAVVAVAPVMVFLVLVLVTM